MATPLDLVTSPGLQCVALIYGALLSVGVVMDVILLVRWLARPPDWNTAIRRLCDRPWTGIDGLRILMILILLHIVGFSLLYIAGLFKIGTVLMEPRVAVVSESLILHWVGLALIATVVIKKRWRWESAFGLSAHKIFRDIATGIVFYLAMLPSVWIAATLYRVVLHAVGYEPDLQSVIWLITGDASPMMRLYLLALAVLLAPVFEELFFRGIGLPLLIRKLGFAGAIFLLAGLFALIHFNVGSFVPLFAVAIAFSLAYIHSGSILVPIVMHAMFNGINVGLLFLLQ